MTRWYRAYAGTVRDDKLGECTIIAGCSRSVIIATWHAILESAAETADGGRFETTPRRVAALLVEPASTIEAAFAAMTEVGMIADGVIVAWKKRQFESDNSTERSRKHREAKRNGDATLQGRCATPPEAETDTDTSADPDKKDRSPHLSGSFAASPSKAAKPFPADGSIFYSPYAAISRRVKPNVDPDVIANAFRSFCHSQAPPIPFDDPRIERRFEGFARNHQIRGH